MIWASDLGGEHRHAAGLFFENDLQQDAARDLVAALGVAHFEALVVEHHLLHIGQRDVAARPGVVEPPVGIFLQDARALALGGLGGSPAGRWHCVRLLVGALDSRRAPHAARAGFPRFGPQLASRADRASGQSSKQAYRLRWKSRRTTTTLRVYIHEHPFVHRWIAVLALFVLAGCTVPGQQMNITAPGASDASADIRARAEIFAIDARTLHKPQTASGGSHVGSARRISADYRTLGLCRRATR